MSEPVEEPVPKLPRGRGLKLSKPELFRIALTLITLIGVIVLTKPCASAVSGFVTSFDGSGSANQHVLPKPGTVDIPGSAASGSATGGAASGSAAMPQDDQYEHLTPNMSEAEIKAAMERAKARNAAGSANAGSANAGSAANRGSAAPAPTP